jgi:hypothetical protein
MVCISGLGECMVGWTKSGTLESLGVHIDFLHMKLNFLFIFGINSLLYMKFNKIKKIMIWTLLWTSEKTAHFRMPKSP